MSHRTAFFLLLALFFPVRMGAQEADRAAAHAFERPIVTVGAGPQKLPVDLPLLTGGRRFTDLVDSGGVMQARNGLADLRLYDRDRREIGYLLINNTPARRELWVAGAILPIAKTEKSSGFETDLGEVRPVDGLAIEGLPPPFLKRFVLEGSGDRSRWTVLVEQGTLFDLPEERVRQTSVGFTRGSYRYLRVTWDDANSGRVPEPRAVRARHGAVRASPLPLRTEVPIARQVSEPGRSRYRLSLPATGLPIVAVLIDAGTGDVFRTAFVTESRFNGTRANPVELGRARLAQAQLSGGTRGALRVAIQAPHGSELQLVI